MWWAIAIGGVLGLLLYLSVLFTLGFATLSKGRGWMFVLGIFFPLFWLIGAIMQPAEGF